MPSGDTLALLVLTRFAVGDRDRAAGDGELPQPRPLGILISLTAWGSLWGVAGAVFSVPITAVLMVVFSELRTRRPISVLLSYDGRLGAP
jgi:hypothetical protein